MSLEQSEQSEIELETLNHLISLLE